MYVVYWSVYQNELRIPQSQEFGSNDMKAALTLTEELRSKQRAGAQIRFVIMVSENPNSVGHPGAAPAPADYEWKKRRD